VFTTKGPQDTPSSVISGAPALTGGRRPGTRQWRAACRAAGDVVSRGSGRGTMTHARSRAHPDRHAARPGHMPAAIDAVSARAGRGQPPAQRPAPGGTGPAAVRQPGRAHHDAGHPRPQPASRDPGREPGVAAAAAVQRLRRPPRNAAAVRRRAGSAADDHPVRHARPAPIPGTAAPVSSGHHGAAAKAAYSTSSAISRPTGWASPGEAGSRSSSPCAARPGCAAWYW
jgi:hypothetical protein